MTCHEIRMKQTSIDLFEPHFRSDEDERQIRSELDTFRVLNE